MGSVCVYKYVCMCIYTHIFSSLLTLKVEVLKKSTSISPRFFRSGADSLL